MSSMDIELVSASNSNKPEDIYVSGRTVSDLERYGTKLNPYFQTPYKRREDEWSEDEIAYLAFVDQESEEFQEIRHSLGTLGASDADRLMSLELDKEKLEKKKEGELMQQFHTSVLYKRFQLMTGNPFLKWVDTDPQAQENFTHGHQTEPISGDMFEWVTEHKQAFDKKKKKLVTLGISVNNKFPYLHASLDRYIEDENANVEIKSRTEKSRSVHTNVPENYWYQIQHQYAVTGVDRAYFVSTRKNKINVFDVPRNEEFITLYLENAKWFTKAVTENDETLLWKCNMHGSGWKYNYRTAATLLYSGEVPKDVFDGIVEKHMK